MPTLAIILIVIAALFHALRDTMTKKSPNKLLFVWWMTFLSFLMLLPVGIYFLWEDGISWSSLLFALGMGFVHAGYWILYTKAYEKGDLSYVYPIIRSAPLLVLIFGVIFLGEIVSLPAVIGILLITFALYIMNLKKLNFTTLVEPIKSIAHNPAMKFAFLALLASATYSLLDKVAVQTIHPFVYMMFMTASALVIFGFFVRKQMSKISKVSKKELENADISGENLSWFSVWNNERKSVIAGGIFASVNYPLLLFALTLTNVSYVVSFRQIGVVFAVLIGSCFFREKQTKIRLFAAFLIFLGAILVAL